MILCFPANSFHQTDCATPHAMPRFALSVKQQTFDASVKSKANRGGLALHYFWAVFQINFVNEPPFRESSSN